MKKRLTRQESRALTQQKLLEAAAKIFARQGFAGASIEEIAESAGFSRGAFHANFRSKDALFLALVEQQVEALLSGIHQLFARPLPAEETRKNLRAAYAYCSGADKDAFLLLTEAQLYALRNPSFGKKLRALFGAIHDNLLRSSEHFQKQMGCEDPALARKLVLVGFALSHGLTLHNLMDPDRYSDTMVSDSARLVFDSIFPRPE